MKPAVWSNGSSGITLQSTAAGQLGRVRTGCSFLSMSRSAESDKSFLAREVEAWEADRNKKHTKANWRFTTENARVKLKHLYPSF